MAVDWRCETHVNKLNEMQNKLTSCLCQICHPGHGKFMKRGRTDRAEWWSQSQTKALQKNEQWHRQRNVADTNK